MYLRPFIDSCEHRDELLVLFGERRYMLNDTPVLSTSSRGIRTSFATIVDASETAAATSSARRLPLVRQRTRHVQPARPARNHTRRADRESCHCSVSTLIEHVAHSECESCSPQGAAVRGRRLCGPRAHLLVPGRQRDRLCGLRLSVSSLVLEWRGGRVSALSAGGRTRSGSVVAAHRLASELGGEGCEGMGMIRGEHERMCRMSRLDTTSE